MTHLILASGSAIRRNLLEKAGLSVRVETANIDERALEATLADVMPDELASQLAIAKAEAVSRTYPDALVIGADQVLSHENTLLHKAQTRVEAHTKLLKLQGSTHQLISAAAIVHNGQALWSGAQAARLTMRTLTEADIDAYLDHAGDAATLSVGAYRLEELGASLFEAIEGDTFTILGLPLLPLLAALRAHGVDPLNVEPAP